MALDIGTAAETLHHYIKLALGDQMQGDMHLELADAISAFQEAANAVTAHSRRITALEKKVFGKDFC